MDQVRDIRAAAEAIHRRIHLRPEIGIVLGSGLGSLADRLEDAVSFPYEEIPHFPQVTVQGHHGRLVVGMLSGRPVAVMQGRFHYYEGHDMPAVVFPVRVMQKVGIHSLILTNAAGGISPWMKPGDLMVLRDHVGLWCDSPLRGPNPDAIGPRFPDMSRIYDEAGIQAALRCAARNGVPIHEGVYCYCKGPMFETPAEIRLLGRLGVDAVGMSTVPEAIAAVHAGLRVLGLSCVTNHAAGISLEPLNHHEVLEIGKRSADGMIRLIRDILAEWPAP